MPKPAALPLFISPPSSYETLDEAAYDDEYPEEDELLSQFVSPEDWDTVRFAVVTINPVEWFRQVDVGGMTMEEAFRDLAEGWQKRLVKSYRRQAKKLAAESCLIINADPDLPADARMIDGFHRTVAFALEGITSAQALNLACEQ